MLLPSLKTVPSWRRRALGRNPFPHDAAGARASFLAPAAALCRRAVYAEALLAAFLPGSRSARFSLGLRAWQASQEATWRFIKTGKPLAGMDLPMTLNFFMALGNYSRAYLFENAPGLSAPDALRLHSVFAAEMTALPAAMAIKRAGFRKILRAPEAIYCSVNSPAASALRLAGAFGRAMAAGRGSGFEALCSALAVVKGAECFAATGPRLAPGAAAVFERARDRARSAALKLLADPSLGALRKAAGEI